LKHLLTHTSGHAYATWNSAVCQLKQAAAVSSSTFSTFDAPLVCDPGDRWEYGAGIDWTGRLIEHISGESLEDYFRAHIFDPLGMDETSFILRDDQRTRVAGRHARQSDGSLLLNDVPIPPRPVIFNGGGGLYSTGPDYLRLLRMLLGDGTYESNTVLRPESVAELARNHIAELTVEALPSAEPEMSNDMEFFPGMVKKWSLGGLLTTEPTPAGRGAGSWAWGGLFNTYFWVDPARGVAGLLLTQILPFCDSAVLALLDRFEADIYAPSDV
jgi:CubicO group peptidase (beta-lactamase class C family)